MARRLSKEALERIVDRLVELGPCEAMREDERAAGWRVVVPGEERWLNTIDWPPDIVVSTDGLTVRIVAIYARAPGTGAFGRLIAAILRARLKPVVVEPMGQVMPAILEHWGWTRFYAEQGFRERHSIWCPPAQPKERT